MMKICSRLLLLLFLSLLFHLVMYPAHEVKILKSNSHVCAENIKDTAIINKLNNIAYQNRRSNPDTAFYLANLALKYSLAAGYEKGIGNAYVTIGYTHLINYSKNDSASIYLQMAYDVFKQSNDDFGIGMVYFGMGYVYSLKGNLKESEKNMLKCLRLFKKTDHKRGIYNAYNSLAYIYQQYKEYGVAFDYIQQALKTATDLRDTLLIADAHNSLGNIYKDQYLFKQATDAYFNALNYWELKEDSDGLSIAYGNIGLMYFFQNDYNKALEYYKKKLPVSIKTKNRWEESRTYNDIGFVFLSDKKYDTSLIYYHKGLLLNLQMNYLPGIADSYYNLANTYLLMAENDSAFAYINKSMKVASGIHSQSRIAENSVLLGRIYFVKGDTKSALVHTNKGYLMGKQLGMPALISQASELLSKLYSFTKRYDLAYKHLNEFKQLQDSLKNEENINKITRLEIQYEFDKKQRKAKYEQEQIRLTHNAAMKHQRFLLQGTLLLIIFVVLLGILLFRQKSLRDRFKNINLEQKLMRVQMNPHFIFNSLCAVQEYILTNKSKEANYFLSRFATLMRSILESSMQDFISLEKEIEVLKNYIEIQRLRFNTDFDFSFTLDKNIDIDSIYIPPMIAQPFIENAIEHGLLPKKEKGFLSVKYEREDSLLKIVIEDNGIGRKNSEALKTGRAIKTISLATVLTTERIRNLRKTVNKKAGMSIEDIHRENGITGTKVTLMIPFMNKNI